MYETPPCMNHSSVILPAAFNELGLSAFTWAITIGGGFALGAIIWSFIGIVNHYRSSDKYPHTSIRSHTIKILWMVPIYAFTSWLGLIAPHFSLYYDIVRAFYEAITIYYFFTLLVAFAGGKGLLIERLTKQKQQGHIWPCNWCMSPWKMGSEIYTNCKWGILQYVIIQACCAVATFVLDYRGLYGEGSSSFLNGYIYIAGAKNVSQMVALYCLVLFYMLIGDDLEAITPMRKFMCIKAVVFFTFWQGVIVSGLVYIHFVNDNEAYTADESAAGIQNFLVCFEMFFAACAHWVSFPIGELSKYNSELPSETLEIAAAITVNKMLSAVNNSNNSAATAAPIPVKSENISSNIAPKYSNLEEL